MGVESRCIVFVSVLVVFGVGMVCSAALANERRTSNVLTSCAPVKPILEMKNFSTDIPDKPVNGKLDRKYDLERCHVSGTCLPSLKFTANLKSHLQYLFPQMTFIIYTTVVTNLAGMSRFNSVSVKRRTARAFLKIKRNF